MPILGSNPGGADFRERWDEISCLCLYDGRPAHVVAGSARQGWPLRSIAEHRASSSPNAAMRASFNASSRSVLRLT
ncbi:MAG: hypothetical protein JO280_08665 [Mycobacteriaceae bacterium]|nr:hypothetical protein [Mycobacteriaceae bacterium]